jgi:hypothetical protein
MNSYDQAGRRIHGSQDPILRAISSNCYLTAQYMATDELHKNAIASADLNRSLRRNPKTPTGASIHVASPRQQLGAMLIVLGQWLNGTGGGKHAAEASQ